MGGQQRGVAWVSLGPARDAPSSNPGSQLSGLGAIAGPQFPQTGSGRKRVGTPVQGAVSSSEPRHFLSSAAPELAGAALPPWT